MTVYGRARLGQDVFLGEVVIPLREVEATADASHSNPDIRRYILGRRNAKEKVPLLLLSNMRQNTVALLLTSVYLGHRSSSVNDQFSITPTAGKWTIHVKSPNC